MIWFLDPPNQHEHLLISKKNWSGRVCLNSEKYFSHTYNTLCYLYFFHFDPLTFLKCSLITRLALSCFKFIDYEQNWKKEDQHS
jgi:hypothetical protein